MIRNPDVDGVADAVRRAVVATTALLTPGLGSGPQGTTGNAGQFNEVTGLFEAYGRFDVTPFSAFTFSDRPRNVE